MRAPVGAVAVVSGLAGIEHAIAAVCGAVGRVAIAGTVVSVIAHLAWVDDAMSAGPPVSVHCGSSGHTPPLPHRGRPRTSSRRAMRIAVARARNPGTSCRPRGLSLKTAGWSVAPIQRRPERARPRRDPRPLSQRTGAMAVPGCGEPVARPLTGPRHEAGVGSGLQAIWGFTYSSDRTRACHVSLSFAGSKALYSTHCPVVELIWRFT